MIKLSIIIPVLNSHEVFRRQMLYFEKIGIPDDTEIIIVDDGSEPPLKYEPKDFTEVLDDANLSCTDEGSFEAISNYRELPIKIIYTNDKRPWTWALARNAGARLAKGDYYLMFDIDHIITRELIDSARTFGGCKMQFLREFGVLTEDGTFTQDLDTLIAYGFPKERFKSRGLLMTPLPNNFCMRKDVYWDIGGYREDLITRPYPQGEDRLFKKGWYIWERKTGEHAHPYRPKIYMFPNGYLCGDVDANPFGLFHNLSRKTSRNTKYV